MTTESTTAYCRPYELLLARAERGEQITAIDAITTFSADPQTASIAAVLKAGGADDIDAAAFASRFNIPPSFVPVLIGALLEVAAGNNEAVIGLRGTQPQRLN